MTRHGSLSNLWLISAGGSSEDLYRRYQNTVILYTVEFCYFLGPEDTWFCA
jgi:hypothetical protein